MTFNAAVSWVCDTEKFCEYVVNTFLATYSKHMKLVFLIPFTVYSIHNPDRAVGNLYLHYNVHINYGSRKHKLGKQSTRGIPFHFTSVYRMGNG